MTKVMCEYVMCKFNESCKPTKAGECLKSEINLVYKQDRDDEMLDCACFKWDNDKKLIKE